MLPSGRAFCGLAAMALLAASCGTGAPSSPTANNPASPTATCGVPQGADDWVLLGRPEGRFEAVYARTDNSRIVFRFVSRPNFYWSFGGNYGWGFDLLLDVDQTRQTGCLGTDCVFFFKVDVDIGADFRLGYDHWTSLNRWDSAAHVWRNVEPDTVALDIVQHPSPAGGVFDVSVSPASLGNPRSLALVFFLTDLIDTGWRVPSSGHFVYAPVCR